jgi:hypothetical protein
VTIGSLGLFRVQQGACFEVNSKDQLSEPLILFYILGLRDRQVKFDSVIL